MRVIGTAAYLPLRSVSICHSLVFLVVDPYNSITSWEIISSTGNSFLSIKNPITRSMLCHLPSFQSRKWLLEANLIISSCPEFCLYWTLISLSGQSYGITHPDVSRVENEFSNCLAIEFSDYLTACQQSLSEWLGWHIYLPALLTLLICYASGFDWIVRKRLWTFYRDYQYIEFLGDQVFRMVEGACLS